MTKEEKKRIRLGKIKEWKRLGINTYGNNFSYFYSYMQSLRSFRKKLIKELLELICASSTGGVIVGYGLRQCSLERKVHIISKYWDDCIKTVFYYPKYELLQLEDIRLNIEDINNSSLIPEDVKTLINISVNHMENELYFFKLGIGEYWEILRWKE